MMLRYELKKYCSQLKFNAGQAEIDYLQHLFLFFLSQHSAQHLIFKGGTALQKCYALPRFSIDLDFTSKNKNSSLELIRAICKEIEQFGYPTTFEEVKTLGETFVLKISGPLRGVSFMSIARLQIEISQRESLLIEPMRVKISPIYHDLKSYSILAMAPEEILSEKIRAIMTRNKPRDVFDLYFLLSKGISLHLNFINSKLAYYQEVFNRKKFIEKVKEKKAVWQQELQEYCSVVPEFEKVLALIEEKIP